MSSDEQRTADAERLRAATEILEAIVRDRGLLGALTVEERTRLIAAAGDLYNPDLEERRRWMKASRRAEKAAARENVEAVLAETGIRVLREKPVYTTPDPPKHAQFEQRDVEDPAFREVVELQHCYVCKERYLALHHFYDQLCPIVRRLQLRQARRDVATCAAAWRCSRAAA